MSDLSNYETEKFVSSWNLVPQTRKQMFLEKLIEVSEDNLELDFSKIFHLCLEDTDKIVREQAVKGLWESEDRTIIKPLTKLLRTDPSVDVRIAAGSSLERFATMGQAGKLTTRDSTRILEALVAVVNDPDEATEVKRRAIEVVANFASPMITEIIQEAYRSTDPNLVQGSLYAMGQNADSRWIPTLYSEIENENAAIRYEATSALGKMGSESIVPSLIHVLQDDDLQVQLAAIQSLGDVGGLKAYQALQNFGANEDNAIKDAVQESLNNIEFDKDPLRLKFDA